ncbi:MAG: hypothetical protein IPK82_42945 [Polyangiaceae bacterium]|nr:hypothetical protein [Polyangiaceae bacterium]
MEIQGKKYVSIYLTDPQMRMVRDFLGLNCHQWLVEVSTSPIMRYMAPRLRKEQLDAGAKRMYLEDWQKAEIKDLTGEECDFVELTHASNLKYKGPVHAELKELQKAG